MVQYTKKKSPYGDRYLPLNDIDIEILKTVKSINDVNGYKESEYIFCDSEGRTKIREIDHCIRKMCRKAGIEVKSAHDIRRTVASELYANGVSAELIREYMGHSDLKTTYDYILNNRDKATTANQIHNALKMCEF